MIGDLTLNEVAEQCRSYSYCSECPYELPEGCMFKVQEPYNWDVEMPTMSIDDAIYKINTVDATNSDVAEALRIAVEALEEKKREKEKGND